MSVVILLVLAILILFLSGQMMRLKSGVVTLKGIAYLLTIALLLTISTLFLTKDIAYDHDTLKHLEFGWPIPFVIQNQERYDPPFPYVMDFGWDLSSNTEGQPAVQVLWENGIASVVIIFCVVLTVWRLYLLLLRRK